MTMKLKKSNDETYVISIYGDLDLYNSNQLKLLVTNMQKRGITKIVIDFENSDYIDSCGIGVLIYIFSMAKKLRLHVYICNLTKTIRKVIELTKLTQFFDIKSSVNEAVDVLDGKVHTC